MEPETALGESRQRVLGTGDEGRAIREANSVIARQERLHDIRRSVATGMAEQLGIQPHIIEAILNHVSGHKAGVAGVYNRASYDREKRAALDLWAREVERLTCAHP